MGALDLFHSYSIVIPLLPAPLIERQHPLSEMLLNLTIFHNLDEHKYNCCELH